jgi:hypothetical protein
MEKFYKRKGKIRAFRYLTFGTNAPTWFLEELDKGSFKFIDHQTLSNDKFQGKSTIEPGDYILINDYGNIYVFSSESFEAQFEECQ